MYDYVMKFETQVNAFLFDSIGSFCPEISVPVAQGSLETTVTITNGDIPEEQQIREFIKVINSVMKENLENESVWNKIDRKIVIGQTRFVGFEKISKSSENHICKKENKYETNKI